jgi:hypothetical protein
MADSCSGSSFVSDRRGVSAVLGFILMFGILILALTTHRKIHSFKRFYDGNTGTA